VLNQVKVQFAMNKGTGTTSTEAHMGKPDPCERLMQFFGYDHLPNDLKAVSMLSHHLATDMLDMLPHNPELTLGLRKLIEAKNYFVQAKIAKDN